MKTRVWFKYFVHDCSKSKTPASVLDRGIHCTDKKSYNRQQRINEKYNTKIIPTNENKCKGKWKRQQDEERSTIDSVITNEEYVETTKPKKSHMKNPIKMRKKITMKLKIN